MPAISNSFLRCALLAFALCAFAATPARAVSWDQEFCVTNNVQLANALIAANDDDTLIKLAVGTYDAKDTWLDSSSPSRPLSIAQTVILRGGYNSDCSDRDNDARSTVLTNSGGTGIYLRVDDDVEVDSLTFRNIGQPVTVLSALSAGTASTFHEVLFKRVVFDRVRATFKADDKISLREVLSYKAPGSCALSVEAVVDYIPDLEDLLVSQTTVADAAGKGLCVHDEGSADVVIENSIFWGNAGGDLGIGTTASNKLYSNTWSTGTVAPAPSSEYNSMHTDPLFQNPTVDDYQLDFSPAISPAINSGDDGAQGASDGYDAWGQQRHIGSTVDRGPLESIIDDTLVLSVTNTSDNVATPANGSLRKAIRTANSAGGYHAIVFNIPGGCDQHIIDVATPMDAISSDMSIDGYSQPGAAKNTHANLSTNAVVCVAIRGDINTDTGLHVAGGNPRVEISGLAFGGFDVAAVQLSSGHNHVVWGNQFGGSVGGVSIGNSQTNIDIGGTAQAVQVGGDDRTQLNVIGSAYYEGIHIASGSSGNQIIGNLIGAGANGTSANPNNFGVSISSGYNSVRDNVISANIYNGLSLSGSGAVHNTISDNRIGVKGGLVICFPAPCSPNYALGNGLNGIIIGYNGPSQNSIYSNQIAWNGGRGVYITDGNRNRMLSNSVHDNQELGVDLDQPGLDSWNNDVSVIGPANRGINFPYAIGAIGTRHQGVVHGLIHSINAAYVVQAYANASCDANGFGEGKTLVGTGIYSITDAGSSNGNTYFDLPISWSQDLSTVGKYITLQVMDEDGNSSEFGNCATYVCDTIFRHGFEGTVAEVCP